MHFEYTIVINQPVEKVFDYVANPANLRSGKVPRPRYAIYNKAPEGS